MVSTVAKRIVWMAVVLMSAGCGGIGIGIISVPTNPNTSAPVEFQMKLTNHGQCPADSMVFLIPFVTDEQLIESGDGESEAFIELFCKGSINFGPGSCSLAGDIITCTLPPPMGPVGPNASTQKSFVLGPSGLPAPIPCTQTGGTIQCQIPPEDQQAFSFQSLRAQAATQSPTLLTTCMPAPMLPLPNAQECSAPRLTPGAMTTLDVTLTSPSDPGRYRTLAFVEQTNGVCQGGGGTIPGQPCNTSDSMPCGSGTCQQSICTSGSNTGEGCAVDGDCIGGGTGSCQACVPDMTTTFVASAGCATTNVGTLAPVASNIGLLMVAAALFGVGAFLLLRHQRRTEPKGV